MLHKSTNQSFLLAAASAALLLVVGCGGGTAPKATPGKSANAVGAADAKCSSKSNCPNIKLIVDATGYNGTALSANVNERTTWSFSGATESSASREIFVYLMYEPSGSSVQGQGSTEVNVVWTPSEIMTSTKSISVLARDVTRCKMMEDNSKKCTDMTKKMSKYETTQEFKYEVVESSADLIDPAFTSQQQQYAGANSGLAGCAGGALPGILSGMLGGGGGLMNGVMGCMNGMIGGLGTTGGTTAPLGGLLGGAQQTQQPVTNP